MTAAYHIGSHRMTRLNGGDRHDTGPPHSITVLLGITGVEQSRQILCDGCITKTVTAAYHIGSHRMTRLNGGDRHDTGPPHSITVLLGIVSRVNRYGYTQDGSRAEQTDIV
ncbi:hypothetical protein J6590_065046 [Homalodisca vitripennis]|nr:hypothetical protein J6590_065046 [Homalodisca vitripennis]